MGKEKPRLGAAVETAAPDGVVSRSDSGVRPQHEERGDVAGTRDGTQHGGLAALEVEGDDPHGLDPPTLVVLHRDVAVVDEVRRGVVLGDEQAAVGDRRQLRLGGRVDGRCGDRPRRLVDGAAVHHVAVGADELLVVALQEHLGLDALGTLQGVVLVGRGRVGQRVQRRDAQHAVTLQDGNGAVLVDDRLAPALGRNGTVVAPQHELAVAAEPVTVGALDRLVGGLLRRVERPDVVLDALARVLPEPDLLATRLEHRVLLRRALDGLAVAAGDVLLLTADAIHDGDVRVDAGPRKGLDLGLHPVGEVAVEQLAVAAVVPQPVVSRQAHRDGSARLEADDRAGGAVAVAQHDPFGLARGLDLGVDAEHGRPLLGVRLVLAVAGRRGCHGGLGHALGRLVPASPTTTGDGEDERCRQGGEHADTRVLTVHCETFLFHEVAHLY